MGQGESRYLQDPSAGEPSKRAPSLQNLEYSPRQFQRRRGPIFLGSSSEHIIPYSANAWRRLSQTYLDQLAREKGQRKTYDDDDFGGSSKKPNFGSTQSLTNTNEFDHHHRQQRTISNLSPLERKVFHQSTDANLYGRKSFTPRAREDRDAEDLRIQNEDHRSTSDNVDYNNRFENLNHGSRVPGSSGDQLQSDSRNQDSFHRNRNDGNQQHQQDPRIHQSNIQNQQNQSSRANHQPNYLDTNQRIQQNQGSRANHQPNNLDSNQRNQSQRTHQSNSQNQGSRANQPNYLDTNQRNQQNQGSSANHQPNNLDSNQQNYHDQRSNQFKRSNGQLQDSRNLSESNLKDPNKQNQISRLATSNIPELKIQYQRNLGSSNDRRDGSTAQHPSQNHGRFPSSNGQPNVSRLTPQSSDNYTEWDSTNPTTEDEEWSYSTSAPYRRHDTTDHQGPSSRLLSGHRHSAKSAPAGSRDHHRESPPNRPQYIPYRIYPRRNRLHLQFTDSSASGSTGGAGASLTNRSGQNVRFQNLILQQQSWNQIGLAKWILILVAMLNIGSTVWNGIYMQNSYDRLERGRPIQGRLYSMSLSERYLWKGLIITGMILNILVNLLAIYGSFLERYWIIWIYTILMFAYGVFGSLSELTRGSYTSWILPALCGVVALSLTHKIHIKQRLIQLWKRQELI